MAKNFKALMEKMPAEARARAEAKARAMITALPLDELREARQMTQMHLAKILGVRQSAISKMERRADMYVSTLSDFIEALGGQLEIRAIFQDGAVKIEKFGERARLLDRK